MRIYRPTANKIVISKSCRNVLTNGKWLGMFPQQQTSVIQHIPSASSASSTSDRSGNPPFSLCYLHPHFYCCGSFLYYLHPRYCYYAIISLHLCLSSSNVYVGTLDTFIEEREIIRETEPYFGGSIDGKDNGPELGIWELDLRSQFPVLFEPYKEVREKIPHSEVIEKCTGKFWIFVSKIHKIQYVHIYTAIFLLFPFISPNKTLEIIFSLCRTGKYSLCYMQCRPRTWIL